MSWLGKKELLVISGTTFIQSLFFFVLFTVSRGLITNIEDSVGLRLILALFGEALLLLLAWQVFQTFHAPRPVIMLKKAIALFFTVIMISVFGPSAALGLKSFNFSSNAESESVQATHKFMVHFESPPTLGILSISGILVVLLILFYIREKKIEDSKAGIA